MKAPALPTVFAAIMRPSADLVGFAATVCGCAVFDALQRPRLFDECYALALIFQMFAASTGFRDRAVRGHFDPLLTRHSRASIAIAHLAVSAGAGALVWVAVTVVDAILVHRLPPTGVTASAAASFACVSLVAWAGGLSLPRYGAGIIWLTALVMFAGSGYATAVRSGLANDPMWAHRLEHAAGAFVAPMLLFAGSSPSPAFDLVLVLLAATAVAVGGALYVMRFEASLKEVA